MFKNRKVETIFNDLDAYRTFCITYGYFFDEKDLYRRNTYAYNQYERARRGDSFVDRWTEDANRAARPISF